MTQENLNEAYSIDTYGAVLELEEAVDALREEHDDGDAKNIGQALAFFDDILPTLKTAVRVRYNGNTDWIPFDTVRADSDELWLLEYDADDSRRIRRRRLADSDIPMRGDSE